MGTLSKSQLYKLNQSKDTQAILESEERQDANELRLQRLERNELDWKAAQKIKDGKLAYEFTTIGEGRRVRHEPTGMLMLNGSLVAERDRLMVRYDNENVEVIVRYLMNRDRVITGVWGDREGKTSVKLVQGMKASFEEEAEEPTPTNWHVHYGGMRWNVVKGDLCAGSFEEPGEASDMVTLLNTFDQNKAKDANKINYREVR